MLLGLVLSFAKSDASELQLAVVLSDTATVSVEWDGQVFVAPQKDRRLIFSGLPTPRAEPVDYRVILGGQEVAKNRVKPVFGADPLRVAVYGDSRDGPGPHATIIEAIAAWDPHLVIHTGDVVQYAGDEAGWLAHFAAAMPLSARVPSILSLGNHEIYVPRGSPPEAYAHARDEVRRYLPPPEDPVGRRHEISALTFHVRIGERLFVSLDSNGPWDEGSKQMAFLDDVLNTVPAKQRFISLHHGPLSSGAHGGHPSGPALLRRAHQHGVTAILAGHDHLYERILDGALSVVVTGGGGAPLYARGHAVQGSQAFASAFNWVGLTLDQQVKLEAWALEGALLDRATLGEAAPRAREGAGVWAILALTTLLLAMIWATAALARRR